MATREDLARIVGWLKDLPPFRDYVKMIEHRRDAAVSRLLNETNPDAAESLRGEARAYDSLLREISTAMKDNNK